MKKLSRKEHELTKQLQEVEKKIDSTTTKEEGFKWACVWGGIKMEINEILNEMKAANYE